MVEAMAKRGPARLPVTGPLAGFEQAVRDGLVGEGYASSSVREAVGALRRLSVWMQARGLGAEEFRAVVVEEYAAQRRSVCNSSQVARRWLGALLRVLGDAGAVTAEADIEPDEVEAILAGFRVFLSGQRLPAAESVRCYASQSRKFLAWLEVPVSESLARLDARTVTAFMLGASVEADSVWSAKAQATAMRSLLRYLHLAGLVPAALSAAVPGAAGWRLAVLPKALPPTQVVALLGSAVTDRPVGLRDRAVLLLLARLGLRGAEVAALGLGEIAWRRGEITVRGKGDRVEALPLPAEVGEALADYIQHGRPRCSATTVFVTCRAPFKPLDASCIRAIMGRACGRAGIPQAGAHRLRHSLATGMLRVGAGLPEVGMVLRHRSNLSTSIYAKVDDTALRSLARPWPGSTP